MLTVSGRSSPFLSVGESLCDIVYVESTSARLCKSAGVCDRTGVAIQDPERTRSEYPGVLGYEYVAASFV
jgi:hypothetical protein